MNHNENKEIERLQDPQYDEYDIGWFGGIASTLDDLDLIISGIDPETVEPDPDYGRIDYLQIALTRYIRTERNNIPKELHG